MNVNFMNEPEFELRQVAIGTSFDKKISPEDIISAPADVVNAKWREWMGLPSARTEATNNPSIKIKELGKQESPEPTDYIDASTESLCFPLDLSFNIKTLELAFGGKAYEDFHTSLNPNILTSLFCDYWEVGREFEDKSIAVLRMMIAARVDGKLRLKGNEWIYV